MRKREERESVEDQMEKRGEKNKRERGERKKRDWKGRERRIETERKA